MNVTVDRSLCDGNGVCMGITPEVFDVDDDMHLHIVSEIPNDPDIHARTQESVTSCPVLALTLHE